jgi:hypothetical protein
MKKLKLRSLIIFLSIPILVCILYILASPPSTYRGIAGPVDEMLSTKGVFKPGGYIDFKLSPKIKSMRGYYEASIDTYSVLFETQERSDSLWSAASHRKSRGKWGGTLGGSGRSSTFSITHRVGIPNDPLLAGRRIIFKLSYNIRFPESLATNLYKEVNENISDTITIDLENKQLTPEEIDWLERDSRFVEIFGIITIFLAFLWPGYGLLPVIRAIKK